MRAALTLLSVVLAAAALLFFFLRETGPTSTSVLPDTSSNLQESDDLELSAPAARAEQSSSLRQEAVTAEEPAAESAPPGTESLCWPRVFMNNPGQSFPRTCP